MRRQAKAPSAGSTMGAGTTRARKSTFATACLAAVALVAFLGSGAPTAGADDCPNAEFRKGAGALLPDCRAYELVSPPHKNGGEVGFYADESGPVSVAGDAVAYGSEGVFADMRWGGPGFTFYLARREGGEWVSRTLMPPPVTTRRGIAAFNPLHFNPDLTQSILWVGNTWQLTDDPEPKQETWYRYGAITRAIERLAASGETNGTGKVTGASLDLSHLVVTSRETLTADPGQPEETIKIYEATEGQLRLIGRKPGTNLPFQEDVTLGGPLDRSTEGAVSEDGRHIFFTSQTSSESSSQKIYRRTDGATSLLVSPSRRTVPDTEAHKWFQTATPDGNRVFFTSPEKLTDDANAAGFRGDLYRYDIEADELVDVSANATPAEVLGVLRIDRAGDRVYFVAGGQLVPGKGQAGEPNLYLWEDDGAPQGSVRYIATLDPDTTTAPANPPDESNWDEGAKIKRSEVTPDGARLLFQSRANLLPGHESNNLSQVYLYDAEADGGDGELICVSCAADGGTDSSGRAPRGVGDAGRGRRAMSADGSRIVFHTTEALLGRDTNGTYDAYLWDEGEISLLSSGTDGAPSYSYGIDESGDDAFFRTLERLVPADVDTVYDLYTAHVNGGLLSQNPPFVTGCADEECREAGTTPPTGAPPVTPSFQGPGDAKPKRPRCGKGKRRIRTKSGKTRCVKKRRAAAKRRARR